MVAWRPVNWIAAVFPFLLLVCIERMECARNVVCYYTNWSQYRSQPNKFMVGNIDAFSCTHVIFSFAKLDSNNVMVAYEVNDRTPNGGQYKALTDLKSINPSLKTLLAVGGWNHGPAPFVQMASNPQSRTQFVLNAITLLRQYNFDGLDIDWEYPVQSDRDNLSLLFQEMRREFDQEAVRTGRPRLLIAMAFSAGIKRARFAYDISRIDMYLDMYNVMTYDYHGSWESNTGLLAPMRSNTDDLSIETTMQWYISQGASRSKINLGLPLYARTWTLQNLQDQRVGAQAGNGTAGRFTRTGGILAYYEVCEKMGQSMPTLHPVGQTMYAVVGNQFMTFDNHQSLQIKLNYIISANLGGAMVWALDFDDFTGQFCSQGRSPLLNFVKSRMASAPTLPTVNTPSPVTQAPVTQAPWTQAPVTQAPWTQAPWTQAPWTQAPLTQAPWTQAPLTQAPWTQAPRTQAPVKPGCQPLGGKAADPTSCRDYFVCRHSGYVHKFQCRGPDEMFNPVSRLCEIRTALNTGLCPLVAG